MVLRGEEMTFSVAQECFGLGLRSEAIVFRNVRVQASGSDQRAEIIKEAAEVRARFANAKAVRRDPLVASFQSILRQVGANSSTVRPSVERLLTFALKHGDLPAINNLVDAYNVASIRSGCSLGAHDLDLLMPPVLLRLLDGSESFTPLGSDQQVPVTAGEFGYVDAANRLLCRLDVLQADLTKVTEATVNALVIVEGTVAHPPQILRKAFDDVIELVTRHCGGVAEIVSFPG
jgi:DNA/RNA-binding domain of Phe-tRNA-synthetase-like protein